MNDQYKYNAFISYSSANREWADWLRKHLEAYRIPRQMEYPGAPKKARKFRPIFQDRRDMRSSWNLHEILREALDQSEYLIVICSPEAAASKWVNEEIRYFKSLGRGDKILSLVVDGNPSAEGENSNACFPPELLLVGDDSTVLVGQQKHTPGAADARPHRDGKYGALLRIIAGLLSVNIEAVAQRERKRRLVRRSLLAFATLLALTIALFTWDYNRLKVKFYKSWTTHWGVPQGIFPIPSGNISDRAYSYRFEFQRNKLRRVEVVNSRGIMNFMSLGSEYENASEIALEYNDNEKLTKAIYTNYLGRILLVENINENNRIITRSSQEDIPLMKSSEPSLESKLTGTSDEDSQINPIRGRTRITRKYCEYDSNGKIVRYTNQDVFGNPAQGRDGTWGYAYEYNKKGIATKIICLGPKGDISVDNRGVQTVLLEFDSMDRYIGETCYGANGKPLIGEEGYASSKNIYDQYDRLIATKMFDPEGRPISIPAGYSEVHLKYDRKSNIAESRFLGIDGNLTIQKEGYAIIKSEWDDNGWVIKSTYFDTDEHLCTSRSGYAGVVWKRDINENEISVRYLGLKGEFIGSAYGYEIRRKFDARGNRTHEEYRNKDGELASSKDGYSSNDSLYDSSDRLIEDRYFDPKGHLTPPTGSYIAMRRMEYGDGGRSISQATFDEFEKPAISKNGAHIIKVNFSEFGLPEEALYYDTEGKPSLNSQGYHKAKATFDDLGRLAEQAYFGRRGDSEPVIDQEQKYHSVKITYNDHGQRSSVKTFDPAGKPMVGKSGVFESRAEYDERGWQTATKYFDPDGKPTFGPDGLSGFRINYDSRKNIVKKINLGPDNKPWKDKDGIALERYGYDQRNNRISYAGFDDQDEPGYCFQGYHKSTTDYDLAGRPVKFKFFGTDGEPTYTKATIASLLGDETSKFGSEQANFSCYRLDYDSYGNPASCAAFGANETPIIGLAGAHKIVIERDLRSGYFSKISFLSAENNPVISNYGYATMELGYNNRGEADSYKYLDSDGRLTMCTDSSLGVDCAAVKIKMDYENKTALIQGYDSSHNPFINSGGYSSVRGKADVYGNPTETEFLGLNGEPVDCIDGWSKIINQIDVYGKTIERTVYKANGNIFPLGPKCYSMEWKYDSSGRKTGEYFMDKGEKPGETASGMSRTEFSYNVVGLETERILLDLTGKPLPTGSFKTEYNAYGQVVNRRWFGQAGKIVCAPGVGYAQVENEYDERHRSIGSQFLTPEGQLVMNEQRWARWSQKFTETGLEVSYFDPTGGLVNGPDGWARLSLREGRQGKLDELEAINADGKSLIGVLVIENCLPGSLAERLGLHPGDIIVKLGKWSALAEGKYKDDWRFRHFFFDRIESRDAEEGMCLRNGKVVHLNVPAGPLKARLRDKWIPREEIENLF